MADLNTIPVRDLNSVGGNPSTPNEGQLHSESDEERNDEAGAEEGENQGSIVEPEHFTERKALRNYSSKKEEKEEKAKKEESDSIHSQGSELASASSDINALSRWSIPRGRNCRVPK